MTATTATSAPNPLLARTVQGGGEIKITRHNHRKDGSVFHNNVGLTRA